MWPEYATHYCTLWHQISEISSKNACLLCFRIFREPLGRFRWRSVQNTLNGMRYKYGSDFGTLAYAQRSKGQKTEKNVKFRDFLKPTAQTPCIFENFTPYWSCYAISQWIIKNFIKIGPRVLELFANARTTIQVAVPYWHESTKYGQIILILSYPYGIRYDLPYAVRSIMNIQMANITSRTVSGHLRGITLPLERIAEHKSLTWCLASFTIFVINPTAW